MSLQELFDEVKLSLLESGGVDNWSWYSESIQEFREMHDIDEDDDLDTSDILCALENGGVDNWEWYSESLDRFYEWKEHAEKFYGTDDYLDYDDFVVQDDKRIKEEELKEKEEAELLIIKEKKEALLKKLEEYAYKKVYDLIVNKVNDEKQALIKFEELIESQSFWAGLGDPSGLKIVEKSKKKAEKYIKENKLPFNMINYMPKAREYYIDAIVKTDAFKNRFESIVK